MALKEMRMMLRKPNSGGMITATAGNDLVHTLGTGRINGTRRTAIIRKVLAYNNTGGNITVQFGTMNLAGAPAFVQYLPDLLVLNGVDNVWNEWEIPAVEFSPVNLALAAGRAGDIYLLASAANVLVSIEVDEFGA